MKRVLLSALTIVTITALTLPGVTAQTGRTAAPTTTKVGLIDMAKVFQDYQKFKDMRASLKAEIERSDAQAKKLAGEVTRIQGEMKDMKSGSPKYSQYEKALLAARGKFEAYRAGEQRELMRKESQIYKQIYVEVTGAVQKYAEYKGYTLVIRFSPKGAETSDTPAEIVDSMNRQVVYHRPNDNITPAVLSYLNKTYKTASTSGSRAPARR